MISATHLHAMLVHFPIALLVVGFISELVALLFKKPFFKNASLFLLLTGSAFLCFSYFSGDFAGEGIEHGPLKMPMDAHEDAAQVTLWIGLVLTVSKLGMLILDLVKPIFTWVNLILFTALIISLTRTAYLGGQLVYKHGAGVELGLPDFTNTEPED